jgi:DeoR/GlpR family transcriptional regulator of sugar metabolism
MISISKQVFLLADHTKFGKTAFVKFADAADKGTPEKVVKEMQNKNIDVYSVRLEETV